MANKNMNLGSGKDDNEMRIQFGLILALCQNCAILHNPLFHAQNFNLFKGRSPMFVWRSTTASLSSTARNFILSACRSKTLAESVLDLRRWMRAKSPG